MGWRLFDKAPPFILTYPAIIDKLSKLGYYPG